MQNNLVAKGGPVVFAEDCSSTSVCTNETPVGTIVWVKIFYLPHDIFKQVISLPRNHRAHYCPPLAFEGEKVHILFSFLLWNVSWMKWLTQNAVQQQPSKKKKGKNKRCAVTCISGKRVALSLGHHEPRHRDVAQLYVSLCLQRSKHLSTIVFPAPREQKGEKWVKERKKWVKGSDFSFFSLILIFFLSFIHCNNIFFVFQVVFHVCLFCWENGSDESKPCSVHGEFKAALFGWT